MTEFFFKLIVIVAVVILMALILAFPVQWLWNDLMPRLFGLHEVTLWDSVELLLLAGFLFKGNSSTSKKD